MKNCRVVLPTLLILFVFAFVQIANSQDEIVTNAAVISLTKAGLDKSVIINKIRTSKINFDLSTDELIKLKQAGVADDVINIMIDAKGGGTTIMQPAVSVVSAVIPGGIVIPDGTEVKVVTLEDVSGKRSREGDQLTFKVAEEVVIDGTLVIAKDAVVKAVVAFAKKPGFAGVSGKLNIRIESTKTVDGQVLKLRASKVGQGGNNTGTTVAMVVLLGPIGLLKHGKDAQIKAGTILSTFTDEDKTVAVNSSLKTIPSPAKQVVDDEKKPNIPTSIKPKTTELNAAVQAPSALPVPTSDKPQTQLNANNPKIIASDVPAPKAEKPATAGTIDAVPIVPRQPDAKMDLPRPSEVKTDFPRPTEVKAVASGPGEIRKTSLGIELVWIQPGEFVMGSTDGEKGEKPARSVKISEGFWMGRHEVTQVQWFTEMGLNPSSFSGCGSNCPVDSVSWEDAKKFIDRLNAKNDGFHYSLPTEAQWEYAARAGSTGTHAGNVDEMAWHSKNSNGTTRPVGSRKPNAFGLFDMHGNVWEWCDGWYGNYSDAAEIDPKGPLTGKDRVLRGGSWKDAGADTRSSIRAWLAPTTRYKDMGFRVVARAK